MTHSLDVFSPAFKADPYPTYARLRERAPVYRVDVDGKHGFWLVTRYADIVAVLRDPRFVKDFRHARTAEHQARMAPVPDVIRVLDQNMLAQDPPNHTRLRALVQSAFSPRLVDSLRPRIEALADRLIDRVQAAGQMDLIADFAFPLPIGIIGALLGMPEHDQGRLREWSMAMVEADRSPAGLQRLVPSMLAFSDYVARLVEDRRTAPAADLITALVQAEEAGERLSQSELFGMLFLLIVAGHETTVNLIGNGMLALLQHPDQRDLLRQRPTLIKPAIEELLRFDGPVETSTARYAREDVDIGGVTIPRGALVLVVIAAGDRDPHRFPDPDRLDISRDTTGHLAFGHGIHYCLGAPLARLEGQIAISTLLRRLPNLRLAAAADHLEWRSGMLLRGLSRLPVAF
jgi:cytochrome P450